MIDIVQVKEMCSKEKWKACVKRNPLTDTECIYLKNEIGECVIIGEISNAEPLKENR